MCLDAFLPWNASSEGSIFQFSNPAKRTHCFMAATNARVLQQYLTVGASRFARITQNYVARVVIWMESSRSIGGHSREYKLVMLGEGGVGKSAIIMQFISHRFPEDHDPTIEDAYKTQIRIDDEPANLDILDTAGQAEFTAMRDQYMRAGEGFIISYSITDRRSFQEARHFKQLIYRVRRTVDTPVVLVGNKSDLVHLRQVSVEEGKQLAREFQCPFFETSAAFRYYIDEVFAALVRQIRQREAEMVRGSERKTRRSHSFWSRLKAPFHKKQQSEH
uniref:small monomeric GTPase n=3 Tax=Cyprinus carpio TaxID=7962 RepID=A0A9J8C043_CYPCA